MQQLQGDIHQVMVCGVAPVERVTCVWDLFCVTTLIYCLQITSITETDTYFQAGIYFGRLYKCNGIYTVRLLFH